MRAKNIIIGKTYKLKQCPEYYAKALEVLGPKNKENTNSFIVVKCIWSQSYESSFGIIKYFKPSNLIEYP